MQFLKRQWVLLVLSVTVITAGTLEIRGRLDRPQFEVNGRGGIPWEADVILARYPESPEADYVRAVEARHLRFDLADALRHIEKGLETGIKAHTDLLYEHALVLTLSNADPAVIEQAVNRWKTHAPDSSLPDPRQLNREFPEPMQAGAAQQIALSDDGQRYAQVLDDGQVGVFELDSEQRLTLSLDSGSVKRLLGFSSDSSRLIAASDQGLLIIFDCLDGTLQAQLDHGGTEPLCAVMNPKLGDCITGSRDGVIRRWTIGGHEASPPTTIGRHAHPVSAIELSRDGSTLATGSWDGGIQVWSVNAASDGDSMAELVQLTGHDAVICDLSFAPRGNLLASAGRDDTARVWSIETGDQQIVLTGHRAPLATVAFSRDGRMIGTGSDDHSVVLWDAESGRPLETFNEPFTTGITAIAFPFDNRSLVAAEYRGSIHQFGLPERGSEN